MIMSLDGRPIIELWKRMVHDYGCPQQGKMLIGNCCQTNDEFLSAFGEEEKEIAAIHEAETKRAALLDSIEKNVVGGGN